MLIDDVRDSVADMVDIVQTYKSKGRLSQVMMSTLFKRRQDEAEAVIDAAVSRLHVSTSFRYNSSNLNCVSGLCCQQTGQAMEYSV